MPDDAFDSRMELQGELRGLLNLLQRQQAAMNRFERVMSRYLQPEKPMRKPWEVKKVRLGIITVIIAVIVFGILDSVSPLLSGLVAVLFVLATVAGGGFLLVRGGPARRYGFLILGTAALMIVSSIIVLQGQGDLSGYASLVLPAAIIAAVLLAFDARNAYLPVVNQEIAESNQAAYDDALSAASSDLEPVVQEIDSIRDTYLAEGYAKWFPKKYTTIEAVSALSEIVRDHRADTIKEAINQYVQDQHNLYMRKSADKQTAIAQMRLAEEQETTRAINNASMLNLGMQAMQGILTRSTIQDTGAGISQAINNSGSGISKAINNLRH